MQDFINAARNQLDVSVGPGRGSAAGSAVAYCLGITQIDPIQYDLLFERFLNPDRISLPDIDVDFDDDGRGRVLNWVTEKYGQEKVAHIITYGTMATKLAIKDVARVQKLPLSESDRLCKLIPDKLPDKKLNLPNAIAYVPELQEAEVSPNPVLRDTIKYAKMLEGNVRNTGVHACGTIICRDDITDWVPVSTADDKETGEKMLVTQYEGSVIEDTGLIKMDFLGLRTLSIVKEAIENIRQSKGIVLNIDEVPIDDPATYRLYSEGRTIGTFQFESAGMQKYLRELQPSRGQQFGSSSKKITSMSMTGTGYATYCSSETACGISSIDVSACAKSGTQITIAVTVGGVAMISTNATNTISGSTASAVVTSNFTSDACLTGDIVITYTLGTPGALYINTIKIN